MPDYLISRSPCGACPITPLAPGGLDAWLKGRPAAERKWVRETGFKAEHGSVCLLPARDGGLTRVLAGIEDTRPDGYFAWGGLAANLPAGDAPAAVYFIDAPLDESAANNAALAWVLGTYQFDRYKSAKAAAGSRVKRVPRRSFATLVCPKMADQALVDRTAEAVFLVRDLVNTPAADMAPVDLAAAARLLARRHKGRCRVIVGNELLKQDYPAVHAVGRAAATSGRRAPRLIDLSWGRAGDPKVTLVGKGVCFDTGGLGLKPAANMRLMKKDMGGAAHVLGLAHMIMDADLPVRLRVLIPAVENSVSGDALRPLDVIKTRKGITVEIGHTDAEGRVVLADALAEASREDPALLIDCATLTGAARVALGPDLPALFCNDETLAGELVRCAEAQADPLWRMPLWPGYRKMIDGTTADITNAANSGFAGAITAALFLQEFVASGIPWAHLDIMAWNTVSRPGRPEGGEAMGMRTLYAAIAERFRRGTREKG